jgi:hypothetical protein
MVMIFSDAVAHMVLLMVLFSDAGMRNWIFLGRFFCARKQVFYGRTKLNFMLPVVLLCYQKVP